MFAARRCDRAAATVVLLAMALASCATPSAATSRAMLQAPPDPSSSRPLTAPRNLACAQSRKAAASQDEDEFTTRGVWHSWREALEQRTCRLCRSGFRSYAHGRGDFGPIIPGRFSLAPAAAIATRATEDALE